MPGHMLSAKCPCGFDGFARVGATPTESRVAAFDPEKEQIVSIRRQDAEKRSWIIFEDPFVIRFFAQYKARHEGTEVARPKPFFTCPKCGEETLLFRRIGFWD